MKAVATENLLAAAAKMHTDRMVRAIHEFPKYALLTNGDLLNKTNGKIYEREGNSGCSCPDFKATVQRMRDAMTAEGVAAPAVCKHWGVRRLLAGGSVKVGNLVFRAKKK